MKVIDVTGTKFNRLTALQRFDQNTPAGKAVWLCICDCGNTIKVTAGHLKSGHTKSCGCAKVEASKKAKYVRHGHRSGNKSSLTYMVWRGMMVRCYVQTVRNYKDYGGRGITVCERWQKFEMFLADMGDQPTGLEIDRIDNNGNYEPSNCRWVTCKVNCNNKRTNHLVEYAGKIMTVSNWAEETGINKHTLRNRIRSGWPLKKAFTK